jgi:predicted lipid-binding transport protein (Tim44 family)
MSDGLHFLDIIFFAMVAAFLVLRLRSVLGRRTGAERPPSEQWSAAAKKGEGKVIDLAAVRRSVAEPSPASPVGQGLAGIRAADPAFDLDTFLAGARAAFEMIVAAYANGDKAKLQPLLAPEVYRHFADAIDARQRAGETLQTELIALRSADPKAACQEGAIAKLTVRFVTEQVNLLHDAAGHVIEGDPSRTTEVIDEWTFHRDVRSGDPNWLLAATHTPEE